MSKADIQPCSGFPAISDHADSDIVFFMGGDKQHYLVFDIHRDFLSAPKAYAIVRIHFSSPPLFGSGGSFLTDDHWSQLQGESFGVFEILNSSYCEQENETHYVFYSRDMTFECIAENIELVDTLYHHASSYLALKAFAF